MMSKQKAGYYAELGGRAIERLLSSALMRSSIFAAAILLLAAASAHADLNLQGYDDATDSVLNTIGCNLRGTVGWILIGLGVGLAAWDYFIQKQGQLIVGAILGIIIIFVLGRVLVDAC